MNFTFHIAIWTLSFYWEELFLCRLNSFTVEKVNSGTQVVPNILEFKTKILFSSHVVIILRNWLIVFITINHSDIKATAYPFQNFFCSSEINYLTLCIINIWIKDVHQELKDNFLKSFYYNSYWHAVLHQFQVYNVVLLNFHHLFHTPHFLPHHHQFFVIKSPSLGFSLSSPLPLLIFF